MPLGMEVDLGLDDCVRRRPSYPQKGHSSPHFSAHILCRQTAGWIKISLGMEVGLSPGNFVLDGYSAPKKKRGGGTARNFRPMSIVNKRLDGSRCHLVRR